MAVAALALTCTTWGCSGGDGGAGGSGGAGGGSGDPIADMLTALGVNVNESPRLDDDGDPLPDDYTPLGSTFELTKTAELFLVGVPRADPDTLDEIGTSVTVIEAEDDPPTALWGDAITPPVWAEHGGDERAFARTTRGATPADVDGDGRQEIAVAYVDRADPSRDRELRLTIIEDAEHDEPFATQDILLLIEANIEDVGVVAGDFDGDGLDELVVAVSTPTRSRLVFVTNEGGTLAAAPGSPRELTKSNETYVTAVQLAAGNLDQDRSEELAVVLNESNNDPFDPAGVATYWVFDDAGTSFAELDTGRVEATSPSITIAQVADVAIGDIDGDRVGEVVLGGIANVDEIVDGCTAAQLVMLVLDDAKRGFASLGSVGEEYYYPCEDHDRTDIRFLHVNTLDVDGDRVDEIALGHRVYATFLDRDLAPLSLKHDGNDEDAFYSGSYVDRSTTQIVAGDVNADGRDELILFHQDNAQIVFHGYNLTGFWVDVGSIAIAHRNSQDPVNPLLVAVNVDSDSIVVRHDGGQHQLVFTEPIVLAALAAPPCVAGIQQNHDACATTFGTATSSTVETEDVLSVSASVTVGIKVDGGVLTQSELEMKATFTTTTSEITSNAYSLTKSILFTTGANEDSVVFTTIPYDRYTYTVVSHPDPELIGKEIVVALPREPITLIAEREFYNATVGEDDLKIDEAVFTHTVGDISTYPTIAQKNAVLGQRGGLQNGPQSVGQGTGSVELGLAVGEEYGEGKSLELGYEVEVQATAATVLVGFSVGVSTENSLMVTSGTETSYTGTIGSISADDFADNQYSFGMFTYVQTDPTTGRQFEVVNYWVE